MGGVQSTENISSQTIRSNIAVLNSSTQNCQGTISQTEIDNVGPGGKQIVGKGGLLEFKEGGTMDLNCVSNIVNESQVISDISQAATQMAKSIGQNLTAGFSDTKATNIAGVLIENAISVKNTTYQSCMVAGYQSEQLNIQGLEEVYGTISFSETTNVVANCTLNASNTTEAQSKISSALSQTAVAIEQNSLAIIAIAVIFVVILFFFFEFGIVELFNWKTLAVIGVFILVYIVIAYELGVWPFSPKPAKEWTTS